MADVRGQLVPFVLPCLPGPPASPSAGEWYFDETLGVFRGWTGSAWEAM